MSDSERKISDATAAGHEGEERSDMKRRALFGMITKTAFVAPVVASFALDALSMDKAHAGGVANGRARPTNPKPPRVECSFWCELKLNMFAF